MLALSRQMTSGYFWQWIRANDVWIAALSRQHAFPVMSRDSHFDFVVRSQE
jgi:predicted nucleic acid-binding protein